MTTEGKGIPPETFAFLYKTNEPALCRLVERRDNMKQHVWVDSQNRKLSVVVHINEEQEKQKAIVVCCHGFTSDKIGTNQLMLNVAKAIAAAGIITVRFDFSGSGESEGEFADDTIVSGWLEDVGNVFHWIKGEPRFSGLPVYLLGHSLGGLIALSYDDAAIAGRLVLAPVVKPIDNFRDIILGPELWQRSVQGETVANFLNKGFSLSPRFARELLEKRYEPLVKAQFYQTPLFIVHGDEDAVVPLAGSQELYFRYKCEKQLEIIPADHVFAGRHTELTSLLVGWLEKQTEGL